MTIRHGQGSVVWELGFPGPARGEGAHFEFREARGTWATLAGTALQFPVISPGDHTYEVRVVPMLGPPGPARRLEIHVLPPWYRHPLAYTLWVLTLAGTVILGFRWRLRRLERRNRELSLAVAQATEGLRARENDLELVNRRLYELNDAKNRIIGLAAHDLRNPLTGILLNCELLQEDLQHPKALKSLGAIRALGATMMTLIQRLLNVHAVEAGHAEAPRIEALDLGPTLAMTLERAQTAAGRKRITLIFASPRSAMAMGDPAQVGQILDNFLSNAVKFSLPGTTITLDLEDQGGWWRASVKDQGPGLTAEDLDRAFGEYARLSALPTAGESSVGLGLSLVKRMAEAMGGRVGVESLPGRGATFWLDLPKP
jgi:signal transduction histidine kinase